MWRQPAPSKDQAQHQPTTAAAAVQATAGPVAWVGKSLIFKGKVMSSEDITIDGRVEGSVQVRDHTLTVGPDARIHADVEAKVVTILGAVTGTIVAGEKVEIRETGSVEGNIVSPLLAMSDGAWLRGSVDDQASQRNPRGVEPGMPVPSVVVP